MGWLDKYSDGKKKFLEPNDKKLPSGRLIPFQPEANNSELASSIGGEQGEPAYLIPTFKYGHPLSNPLEEYERTGEHLGGPFKTWQEADEWDKNVRHPYVEKHEALPSPAKWWGKDYENGGFLGTTNRGRNYSPAWGGQFQNGGTTLPSVTISGVSPRQQAYNDSLVAYNKNPRLQACRDSLAVSDLKFRQRADVRRNNHVSYDLDNTFSAAWERLTKLNGEPPKPIGITKGKFYIGTTEDGPQYIDHAEEYQKPIFPNIKKPVYNPSQFGINPIQPREVTQSIVSQPTINPRPIPNGFTTDLPGYTGVKVFHSQDGKPMYIIDAKGNKQPVVDNDLIPRMAPKKKNGGWLNKYDQAQTGITMPSFEERQKIAQEKAHQIMQQRESNSSDDNSFSNISTDFGTRLLNAVGTLGGSAIGDAVSGVSPQAADWLQKYSLGMIPHTTEEQLKANRSDAPDKWNSRIGQLGEALTNYAAAELVGQGMNKFAPKIANGLEKIEGLKEVPTNSISVSELPVNPYGSFDNIKQGINEARSMATNPTVKEAFDNNVAISDRLGWNTWRHKKGMDLRFEKRNVDNWNDYRIAQTKHPSSIRYSDKNFDNFGRPVPENVQGQMIVSTNPEPHSMWIQSRQSPESTIRTARHEGTHAAYQTQGDLMPIEAEKLQRVIKSPEELTQIGNKYKIENLDLYLENEPEILTNTLDLGSELGIKIGSKYPGVNKFKSMISGYTGDKKWLIDTYKLNKSSDYKKVFDIMNRTTLTTTGVGIGLNQKSEEVGMQNGGEMSYYQHGQDFKPKTISQNGSLIAKNDATYMTPTVDPSKAQAIRQEIIDRQFDYPTYMSQAERYLSRPAFKNSIVKPKDIADAAYDYYQKTDFKMPLNLLLTQAQQETKIGTKLKSKNNIFNIGNTTEGKTRDFNSPREAIDAYVELIHKDYLNEGQKSPEDLLKPKSFINVKGYRYAKDPRYEKKLFNQMQYIDTFLQKKKDGGVVKDNLGYWNPKNFGKIVEIDSPNITMKGVDQPLLGVSDEGQKQMMYPGNDYIFKGKKVKEYPIAKYGINDLNELTNFTNTKSGKWLNKYS